MRNRSDGTQTKAAADAAAFPNPSDAEAPLREPPHGALCRSSDLQIPVDAATTAPAPPSRAGCYRPPVTCFRRKDSRSMLTAAQPRGDGTSPRRNRVRDLHPVPSVDRTTPLLNDAANLAINSVTAKNIPTYLPPRSILRLRPLRAMRRAAKIGETCHILLHLA